MSRPELAVYFAAESGRILLAPLIRNIIRQAHERIRAGVEPPVRGNVRTFWYRWVKPALAHIPDDDRAETDPYDVMVRLFVELILERKLFNYADFDFTDENWENRRIGSTRPDVVVFAEKSGWIRFLRDIHAELGVSVLALGGAPSALTSEYTARHIRAVIGAAPARLVGIVDYDPAGAIIAGAFRDQLTATGLTISSLITVIDPKHYSADELRMYTFPLPKREKTKLAKWLAAAGGIHGEPFGLEAESMPLEKVRNLVRGLVLDGKTG
jgi:hypothetical protein